MDPSTDMVTPYELALDGQSEPTPEDMVGLDELKTLAQAKKVDDSEWYEKQKLPLSQLLIYVDALEAPMTPGTGS